MLTVSRTAMQRACLGLPWNARWTEKKGEVNENSEESEGKAGGSCSPLGVTQALRGDIVQY